MIPVFIVSLRSDLERRHNISKTLDNLGINYEFVDAINGKSLSEDFYNSYKQIGKARIRGYKLSNGEFGCSLSHYNVYDHIKKNKIPWACVLEDDVLLDANFLNFLINFDPEKFFDNNLYILGGQEGLWKRHFIAKSFFVNFKIGKIKFSKTINSTDFVLRACCYLVNFNLAVKLSDFYENKYIFLADDWVFLNRQNIIRDIFIANVVKHPVSLVNSHLESERKLSENSNDNIRFFQSFLTFIRNALRFFKYYPVTFFRRFKR